MATPTTLNIGEPADERSVDGSNAPVSECSFSGDRDAPNEGKKDRDDDQDDVSSPRKSNIDDIENMILNSLMGYEDDYQDRNNEMQDYENESQDSGRFFPEFLITPSDFGYKIAPGVGSVCYGYISFACMDPLWFGRAFGDVHKLVSNVLWIQAHLGIGLYIFSRRHIRKLSTNRALFYSIFGSALFNFGSCMIWGLGRTLLPPSSTLRVAFSLISSCLLLYAGQDYLQYVDNSCSEVD
ncbi:uncharacterized protein LOC131950523 [Physella acuta]|uniref:uncharacterized protein LOC131950523 n=1 Tax=Physella acuta TaxID=109671 RepID=UPI0027DE9357|nr:uncharacterized protein LOC131950523 [Physella acuta]